jgi:hypothetical protein
LSSVNGDYIAKVSIKRQGSAADLYLFFFRRNNEDIYDYWTRYDDEHCRLFNPNIPEQEWINPEDNAGNCDKQIGYGQEEK